MRILKRAILLATVSALALTTATAQTVEREGALPSGSEHMGGISLETQAARQSEQMAQVLALDSNQRERVKLLTLKRMQQDQSNGVLDLQPQRPGRPTAEGTTKEHSGNKNELLKASQASYDANLKDILTPDQYAKFHAVSVGRETKQEAVKHDSVQSAGAKSKAKSTSGSKVKKKKRKRRG